MQCHEIAHPLASIFKVSGRVDLTTTPELEQKVITSLEQGHKHLIMDFSELDYINSAGLRILVMSYQRINPLGGMVMICGARDYIAELFDISGYNRIFEMYPDLPSALQRLEELTSDQAGQ